MRKKALILFAIAAAMAVLLVPMAAAHSPEQEQAADALHELGLFLGTGDRPDGTPTYELDAELTRAQSVTMLIRMLGKEDEVRSGDYPHPFQDTADWYSNYVGYAYANGLTNGTGATTFRGGGPATAQMFAAFCLRALGYEDMNGETDFVWYEASVKADALGIRVNTDAAVYTRGDAVITFWDTLKTKRKGSDKTLAEELISQGVFTYDTFAGIWRGLYGTEPPFPGPGELPPDPLN